MVFITQLVYIHAGQEGVFDAFEAVAIPLIQKHGGELLLRLRPTPENVVAGSMDLPTRSIWCVSRTTRPSRASRPTRIAEDFFS